MSHTPAPWIAQGLYVVGSNDVIVVEANFDLNTPLAVARENAKLIAAAPEMLAVLHEIHTVLGTETFRAKWFTVWQSIEAAIAKAEGQ